MNTSETICKKLSKAGLSIRAYKRSPVPGLNFTMAVGDNGQEIRLFGNDSAELTIHGESRKFNQVAFSLKEKTRKFSQIRVINIALNDGKVKNIETIKKDIAGRIDRLKNAATNMAIPRCRVSSVECLSTPKEIQQAQKATTNWATQVKFKVNFVAGSATTHFLIGKDETSHFICALPEKPTGVLDAHDILMPDNLRDDWERQGEFFFVPVNKKEQTLINESATKWVTKRRSRYGWMSRNQIENLSSHEATVMFKDKKDVYVMGNITDSRRNRHEALNLTSWHKVIRNRERILSTPQAKYFD